MHEYDALITDVVDLIYQTIDQPQKWVDVFDLIGMSIDEQELPSLTLRLHENFSSNYPLTLPRSGCNRTSEQPLLLVHDETVHLLLGHMQRAIHLKKLLVRQAEQAVVSVQMVDVLPKGILIVSIDGEVIHLNPSARSILKSNTALIIRGNRIWSPKAHNQIALQSLINRVVEKKNKGEPINPDIGLVIQNQNDVLRIQVSDTLNHSHGMLRDQKYHDNTVIVMQMTDLNQGISTYTQQQLVTLYHLSKAELRIAVFVAKGLSLHEIAELLELSLHTVRVQLKAIYKKTDTHKQSDLLQLLLRFE